MGLIRVDAFILPGENVQNLRVTYLRCLMHPNINYSTFDNVK